MTKKSKAMLVVEKLQQEERHRVLMELWDHKSKAKIHLKISGMLDDCIERLEELNKLL